MTHDAYLACQKRALSFEGAHPSWANGLRAFMAWAASEYPRTHRVLDAACGDGTGLLALRNLGFTDAVGVDIAPEKLQRARDAACTAIEHDLHDLVSLFEPGRFDLIVSSHTLEHALEPAVVLDNFRTLLVPGGAVRLVVPFPDTGPPDVHCGADLLGTRGSDPKHLVSFLTSAGFTVVSATPKNVREPEIFVHLTRP